MCYPRPQQTVCCFYHDTQPPAGIKSHTTGMMKEHGTTCFRSASDLTDKPHRGCRDSWQSGQEAKPQESTPSSARQARGGTHKGPSQRPTRLQQPASGAQAEEATQEEKQRREGRQTSLKGRGEKKSRGSRESREAGETPRKNSEGRCASVLHHRTLGSHRPASRLHHFSTLSSSITP